MQRQFECKWRSKTRPYIQYIYKEGKIHRCSSSLFHTEPMEPVFFNLLLHLLFALPRFTCINRSAIEVQEYFYTSCTGACTCNCICIFMVQMCIPCVCICAISANHAWGSCLYWRRQLKSMVHDNKLSFDFFYCLLTYKHLLINSYMKEVEFLFWY